MPLVRTIHTFLHASLKLDNLVGLHGHVRRKSLGIHGGKVKGDIKETATEESSAASSQFPARCQENPGKELTRGPSSSMKWLSECSHGNRRLYVRQT